MFCSRVQPEVVHSRKNLRERAQSLSSPWHEALRAARTQHKIFAELLPVLGLRPPWKRRAVVSVSASATPPMNAALKEITAIKRERKKSSMEMAAA